MSYVIMHLYWDIMYFNLTSLFGLKHVFRSLHTWYVFCTAHN